MLVTFVIATTPHIRIQTVSTLLLPNVNAATPANVARAQGYELEQVQNANTATLAPININTFTHHIAT